MTDHVLAALRRLFGDGYDDLKARLRQRLGSADRADDALHDAWLRLARAQAVGVVQSPRNYLLHIALNAAADQRRRESRYHSAVKTEDLYELPDDAPTPEETILAQSDLKAFQVILSELPARRRAIFLAARIGHVPRQTIADRLGISRRLVAKELLLAHRHFVVRYRELRD